MNNPPSNLPVSPSARWRRKFACALRGLKVALAGQSSFFIHLPAAVAVVVLAWWLQVSATGWWVLILCITVVLTAELFNSAIEHQARAITREENSEIRDALDIASSAVLVASIGAAVVGLFVLGRPLFEWLM